MQLSNTCKRFDVGDGVNVILGVIVTLGVIVIVGVGVGVIAQLEHVVPV
jgi:hypothetical protein